MFISFCFNPAEAEEGFKSYAKGDYRHVYYSFNPAEAEEGFKSGEEPPNVVRRGVSIQPKPKKGLKEYQYNPKDCPYIVSIQPKPKKGLKDFLIFLYQSFFLGFNPAEAEEGFKSIYFNSKQLLFLCCFNPAEAEEGFKSMGKNRRRRGKSCVSIQPKPKKGLKDKRKEEIFEILTSRFNPAEAEEGFKRQNRNVHCIGLIVSIQPKPKKGLKGVPIQLFHIQQFRLKRRLKKLSNRVSTIAGQITFFYLHKSKS